MDAKKLIIFCILGFVAIGAAWMIFAPQPEKFENETPAPEAVSATSSAPDGGTLYTNELFGFEASVPAGFTVDESYLNQDLGPGREIPGVAFDIPASLSDGTNLSPDTHLAVEELSDVDCSPSSFLLSPGPVGTATLGANTYQTAASTGAAAGNIYEEKVYILDKGDKCFAVRYFIHSSNIGNYPPGAVKPFDRTALLSGFDALAGSLVFH